MPGTDDRPQVLKALTGLPGLPGLPGYTEAADDAFRITRQGGLTNRVFRVDHPALESVVVRLAGEGTGDYIDRNVELHNACQAALAGVSPDVLHAIPAEGLMVTCLVPDIDTMTPAFSLNGQCEATMMKSHSCRSA